MTSTDTGGPRLARNSMVSLAGRLAGITLSLALAFGLFRALGAERYGAWSLLAAILTAITVVDFGLPAAVEREVAAHRAAGRPDAAGRVVVAALLLIVGVTAVAQSALAAVPVAPSALWAEAWRAAPWLPAAFALGLVGLVIGAGLTGAQHFVAFHAWRVAGLAVGTAGTIAMAVLGETRLERLVVSYALGSVVTIVGCVVSLRRAWPQLPLTSTNAAAVRTLLHFGGALQAASLAPLVADYAFRVLTGRWFGPASTGLYDLAARVSIGFRSLAGSLVTALVPHAVQLWTSGGSAAIEGLHRRTVAVIAFLMLPATAAGVFVAPRVARLVVPGGTGSADTFATTVVVMLVAHLASTIVVPGLLLARAARRPWPEAVGSALGAGAGLAAASLAPTLATAAGVLWLTQAIALAAAWIWLARSLPYSGLVSRTVWGTAALAAAALAIATGLDYVVGSTRLTALGGVAGLLALVVTFAAGAVTADLIPPEIGRYLPRRGRRTDTR